MSLGSLKVHSDALPSRVGASGNWSASLLDIIFRHSGDAILTYDLNGTVSSWNAAATRTFDYPPDEIVGRRVLLLVPEDLREQNDEIVRRVEAGEEFANLQTTRLTKSGKKVAVSVTISPVRDQLGSVIGMVEIHCEIWAKDVRPYLAAIVESSDDAIVSKDTNGIIKSWNRGAERMFGYSADEIIGRPILTLIPKELHAEEVTILDRLRAGERIDHFETTRIRKNGERLEISLTVSPVKDPSGKIIGASKVIRDVSQQKTAERRLRQAYKMEALGQLTGGIAHDFNNILAIMMGNLELIASTCSSDPLTKERIQQTVTAAERAADLTRRLLAFARQQPLDPAILDMAAVVNNAAEFIRSSLGASVLLSITIPPALWPTKIDKNQFENALLNLAVNARDAMPGGGRLYIDCQNVEVQEPQNDLLGTLSPGEYVLFSVRDTGTGMAPEALARATEPFFTTKPIGRGTGLGLSMVYGFVKQSGGHIRIESQLSIGTTIHLYLPRATPEEAEPSYASPALAGQVLHGTETILIVEDEPDIRTTLTYAVESLGYHVLRAEDGPTAIAQLRSEQHIDLLLTDITLPNGMNGVMIAEEAVSLHPAIKVIFSSGYTSNVLIRDYKLAEGAHLLTKPLRLKDLFTTIRNVLDGSLPYENLVP